MRYIESSILRAPEEALPRLEVLGTDLARLLRVRDVALQEASNVDPFNCANAAGTFAYQHGVHALRVEHVDGVEWRSDRSENVEGIVNEGRGVRILFSNVDFACRDDLDPKPRSAKGSGSERVCSGNNLFGHLPEYTRPPEEGLATYYLMVDETGAAELTRPIVARGTFTSYVERIWLSTGFEDEDPIGLRPSLDDDDAISDFDPQVARKR